MRAHKTQTEIEFLQRVDKLYRDGDTQERIAECVGLTGKSSLHGQVNRLGFRFDRRGGLKLVDVMFNRPLADWIASGDLTALVDTPTPAVA